MPHQRPHLSPLSGKHLSPTFSRNPYFFSSSPPSAFIFSICLRNSHPDIFLSFSAFKSRLRPVSLYSLKKPGRSGSMLGNMAGPQNAYDISRFLAPHLVRESPWLCSKG